jgi:hypothetical protein
MVTNITCAKEGKKREAIAENTTKIIIIKKTDAITYDRIFFVVYALVALALSLSFMNNCSSNNRRRKAKM